jgi:DNA-binding response OmpR family regulator
MSRGSDVSLTLLLLDHDDDSRRAVARLLRRNGFSVTTASSTAQALSMPSRFDLAVFDFELPDDSLKLARQLLDRGRVSQIVFFGDTSGVVKRQASEIGVIVNRRDGVRALTDALINLVARRQSALVIKARRRKGGHGQPEP